MTIRLFHWMLSAHYHFSSFQRSEIEILTRNAGCNGRCSFGCRGRDLSWRAARR